RIRLLRLDRLVRAGLATDLLSWKTKLRLVALVADIAVAKLRGRLDYDDLRRAAPMDRETARDYVLRTAGPEADAFLGEPITRALLLADSDQFSRVELMSGLINAVAGSLGTLAGGQAAIIDALVKHLHADIRLGTPVGAIARDGDDVLVTAAGGAGGVDDDSGVAGEPAETTRRYDGCVLACPPAAAAAIHPDPALRGLAGTLRFNRAINAPIGTRRTPDAPEFLAPIPRVEDPEIAMIIVESNKAADRAPQGRGLFTVSWEMSAADRWWDRPDDDIVQRSLLPLTRLFGDLGVELTYVRRWSPALPHTRPGAYRAIADFADSIDPGSPVQYAGDWLSQTGQNTAVAWGERAAANLVNRSEERR